VPPTTVEGIERYLGSGLAKGIGPILAKKLVGQFGTEVLSVIEYRSPELQRVDGIGPKRRERMKRAWNDAKQVREIMLFLHGHGVSTSRAVRIFKAYGEQAIEKVRSKTIPISTYQNWRYVTLAQYTEAVLQHTRGQYDAGGETIHDTPKETRRKFAAEIWQRRRAHGTDRQTPF
jgi:ATP-dependent exoDNAse (exonuclease V) alpha subunit